MRSLINRLTSQPSSLWALVFLMVLSYFTIVHNFWNPPHLFWDENYHIASAQKYLSHTYFMEPHPPLGKLLIALGEKIIDRNELDNQFIGTDYATDPPAGFSFTGYRLIPTLLAWLTVPVLFAIFLLITRNSLWSLLLSFFYVFDNAQIVHVRSAMLESTLLFFALLTVLSFFILIKHTDDKRLFRIASVLFGLSFAGVMTTKVFGLILILLVPALLWFLRKNLPAFFHFLWMSIVSFVVLYAGVWHIHFALGDTVNPQLPDAGYYQASDQYKAILDAGRNDSFFAFPIMLRDSLAFMPHYERGVPRLDMCKLDENGSPWFFWPFGGRSINYRWETPDGNAYRYLYLISNPVVWLAGLAGVALAFMLLSSSVLLDLKEKVKERQLLLLFFGLYCSFLIAVSTIDRVMYLYHYFLPLHFTFILFALAFMNIDRIGPLRLTTDRKTNVLLGLGVLIFLSFQFYRPFTYYLPLTEEQFEKRNIFKLWDLQCVNCPRNNLLVIPKN